jgi:protein-ribulosamine 3-kinase
MNSALESAILSALSETLGLEIGLIQKQPVGGGSCTAAWHMLSTRGEFFVKLQRSEEQDYFKAESLGLKELSKAQLASELKPKTPYLTIPKAHAYGQCEGMAFLAMEHLNFSSNGNEEHLGEAIANLHRITAKQHGWIMDNTLGPTPQPNQQHKDWCEFFKTQRLSYMLTLAQSRGCKIPEGKALLDNFPSLFENTQPAPSLLHGDLWRGNVAFLNHGQPCIFDPATHYGDRECDIAMTELFGGFSRSFYEGYRSIWPLEAGYEKRKKLYQLYHVLNHFVIFGEPYGQQANHMVNEILKFI